MISFSLEGGNELSIIAETGRLSSAVLMAAEESGQLVMRSLQSFPFKGQGKDRADSFASKLSMDVIDSPSGVEVRITSQSSHAAYLELGTRGGYTIYPHGKALVWDGRRMAETSKGGQLDASGKAAAKYVVSPGIANPPKPFQNSLDSNLAEIESIFEAAIAQAFITGNGQVLGGGLV